MAVETASDAPDFGIGDRFREMFVLLRRASPTTLIIGVCGAVVSTLLSLLGPDPDAVDASVGPGFAMTSDAIALALVDLAVMQFVLSMQTLATNDAARGETRSPTVYIRPAFRSFGRLIGVGLVLFAFAAVPFLVSLSIWYGLIRLLDGYGAFVVVAAILSFFAIVPFLWAYVVFAPVTTVVIIEGLCLKAFARSRALTKGHRQSIAVVFFLAWLLTIIAHGFLFEGFFELSDDSPVPSFGLPTVADLLLTALLSCLWTALSVSIYRRLVQLQR